MSYLAKRFYAAVCEECGVTHDGYEYDFWADMSDADDDALTDYWQVWCNEKGVTHHRCENHWKLTCCRCGVTAEGAFNSPCFADWDFDDFAFPLCAACCV